jgi:hypothetical protein
VILRGVEYKPGNTYHLWRVADDWTVVPVVARAEHLGSLFNVGGGLSLRLGKFLFESRELAVEHLEKLLAKRVTRARRELRAAKSKVDKFEGLLQDVRGMIVADGVEDCE